MLKKQLKQQTQTKKPSGAEQMPNPMFALGEEDEPADLESADGAAEALD